MTSALETARVRSTDQTGERVARYPRVRRVKFDPSGTDHAVSFERWKEHREMVAILCLGMWDIRPYATSAQMRGLRDFGGTPSRVNVPRFNTLDEAWEVMNWFNAKAGTMIGAVFFGALVIAGDAGPNALLGIQPHDLTRKIMDAAITALRHAEKQGWLR